MDVTTNIVVHSDGIDDQGRQAVIEAATRFFQKAFIHLTTGDIFLYGSNQWARVERRVVEVLDNQEAIIRLWVEPNSEPQGRVDPES